MRPTTTLLLLACLLAACTSAQAPELPGGNPPATATDAGTTTSSPPTTGCGSGGGGATGGPADLFPCDSTWYKDVSGLSPAAESSSIIGTVQGAGGWGLTNHFQIAFGATVIHADSTTSRREVWLEPKNASDGNAYYPLESDLVSGKGWSMPTPASGRLQGQSGYVCPQAVVNGQFVNQADCHLTVVDDSRHLLLELYGASLDADSGRWYATQESVWNLNYSYGASERGRGCTSADAAGLPISAGVIGLREAAAAAKSGEGLKHALRFMLPNDRTRRAFIAPASHAQNTAQLTSSGPPYGTRLRLNASFDESRIASAGGKVVARTLKRYGMILADDGETAIAADDDSFLRLSDSSLTWSGLLGPFDLFPLQVTDFEVVDYDTSTLTVGAGGCVGVDRAPLAAVTPQGRLKQLRNRALRRHR